jgi:hypothetical protein
LTYFIVAITTHKKWLVKTIIRWAFCIFYPGISWWVQENEENANIKFKMATQQLMSFDNDRLSKDNIFF